MKYKYLFLNIFWIIILSIIPVYYTWGRLAVGGDVLIFFSSNGLAKYLYQWIPYHNGQNYSINYYPLYLLYRLAENIKADPYQVSAFILFILSLLAGLGIYKLTKLICGKDGLFMLVPITFYILSPALLNGWHYMYIYSTAPFFLYFVFKILKDREISLANIIWLNVLIFFSSMDLPNPKYLFHMFIIMFVTLFLGVVFKIISVNLFRKNWLKIILFFLLSAYIYLPLAHFYIQFSGVIPVKSGYKTEGRMPDFGYATIDQMVLLHHKGVNLNTLEANKYTSNPFVTFFSYTFIFLIILNFIIRNRDDETFKHEMIFYVLILIFLFFAAGPNPPLGFIYEYVVSNYVAFAFLRTTAGAVFFLSIFYAVLLGGFTQRLKNYQKLFIILFIIVTAIVGYPNINGEYYKNFNRVNEYTNRQEHGFIIPPVYFDLVDIIKTQKLDAKYVHTRVNLSYMGTRWGYFGPSIYLFLYDNSNVPYNKIYSNLANHNIGYVFIDNSSVNPGVRFKYQVGKILIDRSPIKIDVISRDEFLPHFYTPRNIIVTDKIVDDLYQIIDKPEYNMRSAMYINNEDFQTQNMELINQIPKEINSTPVLEFKKIDPTKFRVIIHQAKSNFLLVFSESYHSGWKAYVVKSKVIPIQSGQKSKADELNNYKIIDNNEEDQATKGELVSFIDKGWVTVLGDKKIDFVSKNFADTIQNDSLPNGSFYETWLAQSSPGRSRFATPSRWPNGLLEGGFWRNIIQIPEENHQTVNVFANSWWIEVDKVCKDDSLCTINSDGSYDFEMIIEYWPQRVFYVGVIILMVTLFICIIYLTFRRFKAIVQSTQ